MKILNYISCPLCKSDLTQSGNFLACHKCDWNYEIVNDIPVLVDTKNLPTHLKQQVAYFEKEDKNRPEYKLEEWQKNYLKRFLNNFSNLNDKLVLDCGAGTGYMSIELAKLGVNVIACDLTLKNLIKLKKVASDLNLLNKITFICCSAEELPFKKGIFDYFISNAVLEHLPKEEEAINEINRTCKYQAGVMITAPLSYKYLNPLLLPINYIHDKRIGHLRRYNIDIVRGKFSGWQIFAAYYTGHFTKVFKSLFNMVFKYFDEKEIERQDKLKEDHKFGASNIICFLRR